jgi:hypothetical protein
MVNGCLLPDTSVFYEKPFSTPSNPENKEATATGSPPNGSPLTATDPAEVKLGTAGITIDKTVLPANSNSPACTLAMPGDELYEAAEGAFAKYCYIIQNTGSTPLCSITLDDSATVSGFTTLVTGSPMVDGCLAPGDKVLVEGPPFDIPKGGESEDATATGTPSPDGTPVSASDNAAVDDTNITLEKTVVVDDGTPCENAALMESLEAKVGTPVKYCYKITNNGNAKLCDLVLSDEDIAAGFVTSITGDMQDGCLKGGSSVWFEMAFPMPGQGESKDATVTGKTPSGQDVSASDPAAIVPIELTAAPVQPTSAPVQPTPAPVQEVVTRAPVEDKVPDPTPPPGCVPMDSPNMGSTYCAGTGAMLINTVPNDSAPEVSFALEDIFYDINGASDTVSFKARNPFQGTMDMYLRYSKATTGLSTNFCVKGNDVDECLDMGVGSVEATCQNIATKPLALVSVYFVDNSAAVLGPGGAEVDECCQPDVPPNASVVAYTFKIYCSCTTA